MAELLWLLTGLTALLAATGLICLRLRFPPALGYLLVGVALPEAVTDTRLQEIIHLQEVSHVAVLILLFFIGMELDLRTLRKVLRETRVVSIFNILVPALFVAGLARIAGWSLLQSVVLGIALSLSSTIFGERLSASREFPAEARHRMFGILLAEDVAAGALLALMAVMAGGNVSGDWTQPLITVGVLLVSLVVLAAIALLAVPRFIDRVAALHSQELLILVAGAFLLAFSSAGSWAGSGELGAFLAGMAAAEAGARFVVRSTLKPLHSISLAVFFFASGLVVDPFVAIQQWPMVLACIALVILTKVIVHVPSAYGKGMSLEQSLRVGFGLSTVGEFSLILLVAAQASDMAHPALASVITGTIVGLLVASPILMKAVPAIARRLNRIPLDASRPIKILAQGLRRDATQQPPSTKRRSQRARIASALLVVLLIVAAAVALDTWVPAQFPGIKALYLRSLVYGIALAAIAPFAYQLYRGYQRFIRRWLEVGDAPSRAELLKLRIAQALIVLIFVLLAAPVAFVLGASLPLLLGSLFLAVIVAVLGWRFLSGLTQNLEGSIARVLGSESMPPLLMDEALNRYGWDFRVVAINVPFSSPLVGQSIGDVRLRTVTGATVAVIKRGSQEIVSPPPAERFRFGDTIVLLGDPGQLARAEALLQGGEEPLRMAAESRAAEVEDIELEEGCQIVAERPAKRNLEKATGAILLGYWRKGAEHPQQWESEPPAAGDRLIALGAPLQLSRVRAMAAAPEPVEAEQGETARPPAKGAKPAGDGV